MPIIIGIALVGALGGYIFANNVNSTISLAEGVVVGAVLGVGAAAVYFAYVKI